MFQKGKYEIEKEINIINMVRGIKRNKILLKKSMMSRDVKFKIAHGDKNCINIDSNESEDNEHWTEG